MNSKRTLAILPLLGALAVPTLAQASGLGNLTYTDQELFKSIANFGGEGATKWPSGPTGCNTVIMIHQKLVVMGSFDSGKGTGSFHMYDMSDPRHPVLQKTYDGTPETAKIRELHAMPVALIDGKTVLVVPTTGGVQFFDFTDPLNPSPLGSLDLSKQGVNGGDYDNTLWMLSYEWPYLFAGGTGNGIFVIDATDPSNPSLLTHIPTGSLGGFRIGPTYAAGNYVIGLNMDQAPAPTRVAVIDASNPKTPFLSATGETPFALYSALTVGDRIYGPGTKGDYVEFKWSGSAVSVVATSKNGTDRGGYCAFESPFLICGQSSEGFKKWDTTGDKLTFAGNGRDQTPEAASGDFDFATALGNLVFLGNDHGSGAALIPHQTAMDTTPPAVLKVYPSEAKQPLTSRITIFFTEDIDLDTVNATNIVVRDISGHVVPGNFSKSSFDAISFGAKAPLAANTTYEVYVPAGGVQDLVGNKSTVASTVRFSTGPTIDMTGIPVGGGGADAGGASGQSGAAGSAAAGAPAGGAATDGGASAVGGSVSASAGAPVTASGGSTPASSGGSAGSATPREPPSAPESGACSCSMPGGGASSSAWALGLGAMCVGLSRLRGRNRRRAGTRQA
jgi:hypothetical protein